MSTPKHPPYHPYAPSQYDHMFPILLWVVDHFLCTSDGAKKDPFSFSQLILIFTFPALGTKYSNVPVYFS